MKLIHDCVRDVMLYVEENLIDDKIMDIQTIAKNLSTYSLADINYTCKKLDEAGYLIVNPLSFDCNIVTEMTYNGHLFLDDIRDDGVWKAVKSKASKVAGVSLPILQQLASAYIATKLGLG